MRLIAHIVALGFIAVMAIGAASVAEEIGLQAAPKPCARFMHTFEPPPGWVDAKAFLTEVGTVGMIYRYEDNSAVAIFPPYEFEEAGE